MIKRILLSLALVCSSVAGGQSVTQLPRSSPADSTLFLCSDSTKTLTRACKFSDVQKRLAFKTFDSLVTGNIRITGTCAGCGAAFPLLAPDGTAAAPSYSFTNSTGLGVYRFGADTLGISTAGVNTLQISGGALTKIVGGAGNMVIQSGTGNSRQLTFRTTSNTGFGTNAIRINELQQSIFPAGTAANPGLTVGDSTLGFYRLGSLGANDTLAIATGGAASLGIRGGASPTIFGGAGNMTIQSGTGNSRQLAIQTTTSAGAATTAARFNEVQQSLFASGTAARPGIGFASDTTTGLSLPAAGTVRMSVTGAGVWTADGTVHTFANAATTTLSLTGAGAATLTGGAGNMTITAGVGVSRTLSLQTTNSSSSATTFLSGSGDTLKTTHIIAVGLTAASGTPNSLCLVAATKQVTENAATSCVVSSIRFKKDTAALSTSEARRIISKLTPETFTYKDGGRKAIGLIAEQVDTVDHRLTFKNPSGELNSVDYQALGPILIKIVQDQQRQLDSIKTILKARKP